MATEGHKILRRASSSATADVVRVRRSGRVASDARQLADIIRLVTELLLVALAALQNGISSEASNSSTARSAPSALPPSNSTDEAMILV